MAWEPWLRGNLVESIQKDRESTITPEEIDEALKQGAENAKELRKHLDKVFTLGPKNRNLVLD